MTSLSQLGCNLAGFSTEVPTPGTPPWVTLFPSVPGVLGESGQRGACLG